MGAKKSKKAPSLGDVLRERGKTPGSDDIGAVWREQKLIRKEDMLLKKKYRESKKRARQLKKKILANQIGDKTSSLGSYSRKLKKTAVNAYNKRDFKKDSKSLRKHLSRAFNRLRNSKKLAFTAFAVILLVGFLGNNLINGGDDSPSTLGSSSNGSVQTVDDQSNVFTVTETPFKLLFREGNDNTNTEIVRISPLDKAPAFTYIDNFMDATLQVSQQEIPPKFENNRDEELAELAENFQASSVIEIDGEKVYHGYSENDGVVQSLIFIKNELLILIAADKQLPDEQWVSYILTLK